MASTPEDVVMEAAQAVESKEAVEVVEAADSVQDVEIVEVVPPPAKRVKSETTGRSCKFCSNKKIVAAGCAFQACKKCCLAREGVCPTHPKEMEKPDAEHAKPKKPVLKNEFRETNFHYYGETVTIFCVRDFFENKKLSQGVLNDQERAERVSGKVWGRRKKKNAANPKTKELIQCALGKRPAPEGYGADAPAPITVVDA
ncbi:hypothetical protein PPTG_11994 [Phytophthora nicotianae INRA-310]|uniref:Uncharacterized protein n=1 Tax=Phytophthora nicotianae (strain INRA-310) TaxID=761204 RepID=W2Q5G7_PHYN3|nr:hypothetical protein PPTG_11994 [Phytophthora nicotianae INRA-310]ETN08131.1 hypothetical protein PPTG_11994 [Phytophthora nicotianae INRA-310]